MQETIEEWFERHCVKITYDEENGSGVLIPMDNNEVYCITAAHCIKYAKQMDKEKLIIKREISSNLQQFTYCYIDNFIIEELDIAILRLKCTEPLSKVMIKELKLGVDVKNVGFPEFLEINDNQIRRYDLSGKVNKVTTDNKIIVESLTPFFTYDNSASELIPGMSGEGIFGVDRGTIYLGGIITDLSAKNGAYSSLLGITIKRINTVLIANKWKSINPYDYSDFKNFDADVKLFDKPMDTVFRKKKQHIYSNIKPKNIVEHCGKKLIWPYGMPDIGDRKLWSIWLLYLILRCIEDENNIKEGRVYCIDGIRGKRKIKLIYVTNNTKLDTFLKDFIIHSEEENLEDRELILVETCSFPPYTIYLEPERVKEIVSDIADDDLENNHLLIDSVKDTSKGISMMHISNLINDIRSMLEKRCSEKMEEEEVTKMVRDRLHEVLYEY
ncbi:ABC-three component system protein [Lacrimispora algidixylanolytica]|uniref:ABC-three component systems C-terminal domain-containing protein n=1 Tax=Lacrimispora algidixylanolytica TaxID=94868 RepID=A0A419T902_9FIRM|nr:ABC-three component system protein [Lacrimispora algidixylanolytica]RKD33946.1 hypothetical protein BET01_12320 [Lacrimispora algidixylanolytica]